MAARSSWMSVLDNADEETARFILQSQLDDIATFPEGEGGPDEAAARQVWETELKQYRAIHFFDEATTPAPPRATTSTVPTRPGVQPLPPETTAIVNAHAPEGASTPSAPAPKPQIALKHQYTPHVVCIVCTEPTPTTDCYKAPCDHDYCDICLDSLFRHSMTDSSVYPPRCCKKKMPYEQIRLFLSPELRHDFEAKREEMNDQHPAYCNIKTCSTYIGAGHRDNGAATCSKCNVRTCLSCHAAAHDGTCPPNEELHGVLTLASKEGWRRCDACKHMVELFHGCNHMTCHCRNQFCYVCGATWKTCGCIRFEERHLIYRTEEVHRRERGERATIVAHLRNNVCDGHDVHKYLAVFGCDVCGDTLDQYIHRCSHCHTQMCNWCKAFDRNRA